MERKFITFMSFVHSWREPQLPRAPTNQYTSQQSVDGNDRNRDVCGRRRRRSDADEGKWSSNFLNEVTQSVVLVAFVRSLARSVMLAKKKLLANR